MENYDDLDNALRKAVGNVMAKRNLKEEDYAEVRTLLDRKAQEWRRPIEEKIRRIKAGAWES